MVEYWNTGFSSNRSYMKFLGCVLLNLFQDLTHWSHVVRFRIKSGMTTSCFGNSPPMGER